MDYGSSYMLMNKLADSAGAQGQLALCLLLTSSAHLVGLVAGSCLLLVSAVRDSCGCSLSVVCAEDPFNWARLGERGARKSSILTALLALEPRTSPASGAGLRHMHW
eukprot:2045741-Amphidinium_carterae.2